MTLFEPYQMHGTRRIDEMMADTRRLAYAENYSLTEGWSDDTLVAIFNLALDRLYWAVTQIDNPANVEQVALDSVATVDEYDLPIDVHMAIRMVDIRYIWGTQPYEFTTLVQGMIQDRFSYPTNIPDTYAIRNGKIILSPTPNITKAGSIVINYQKRMKKLDIRRGKVVSYLDASDGWSIDAWSTSPWGATNGPNIVFQLSFDTNSRKDANMAPNAPLLDTVDYACFVDQFGGLIVGAIPLERYDEQTFQLYAIPAYSIPAADLALLTAALASQSPVYVVQGDYSSTHSQLDRQCEDHFMEYSILRLLRLQSNAEETIVQDQVEKECLDRLVNAYRRYRQSIYPVIWVNQTRSSSWPFGRRGMF